MPVLDQDEALDFYTTHLGFEVRDDIDLGFMRWLTVGVPGPGHRRSCSSSSAAPSTTRPPPRRCASSSPRARSAGVFLLSDDVHATYAALRDAGVEITQEPVEQPYGTDFGIRDPFGNHVRISQLNAASPPRSGRLRGDRA